MAQEKTETFAFCQQLQRKRNVNPSLWQNGHSAYGVPPALFGCQPCQQTSERYLMSVTYRRLLAQYQALWRVRPIISLGYHAGRAAASRSGC